MSSVVLFYSALKLVSFRTLLKHKVSGQKILLQLGARFDEVKKYTLQRAEDYRNLRSSSNTPKKPQTPITTKQTHANKGISSKLATLRKITKRL